jgi:hypothetical protein
MLLPHQAASKAVESAGRSMSHLLRRVLQVTERASRVRGQRLRCRGSKMFVVFPLWLHLPCCGSRRYNGGRLELPRSLHARVQVEPNAPEVESSRALQDADHQDMQRHFRFERMRKTVTRHTARTVWTALLQLRSTHPQCSGAPRRYDTATTRLDRTSWTPLVFQRTGRLRRPQSRAPLTRTPCGPSASLRS